MAETTYLAHTDVVDEVRDFVRLVSDAESENRNAGEQDLLFKAGDQWPATVEKVVQSGFTCLPLEGVRPVDLDHGQGAAFGCDRVSRRICWMRDVV